MWKVSAKLLMSVFMVASFFAAKYATLSFLKARQNEEVSDKEHHLFAFVYIGTWLASLVVCACLALFVYIIYIRTILLQHHSLPKLVQNFIAGCYEIYGKNTWFVACALLILSILQVMFMIYFIEIRAKDNVVFIGVNEDDTIDNDNNGIGYTYRLVEMMHIINLGLVSLGLVFIEMMLPA
jgi:hypothetical protein